MWVIDVIPPPQQQMKLPNGQPLQPKIAVHIGPAISGVLGRSRLDFEFIGAAVHASRMLAQRLPPGVLVATRMAMDAITQAHDWKPCGSVLLGDNNTMVEVYVYTCLPWREECANLVATMAACLASNPTPKSTVMSLLSPPFDTCVHGAAKKAPPLEWGDIKAELHAVPVVKSLMDEDADAMMVKSQQPKASMQSHDMHTMTLPLNASQVAHDVWSLRFLDEHVDRLYESWLSGSFHGVGVFWWGDVGG